MADLNNDPIYREIVAARTKLLFDNPFFGNLAARLKLVDATNWLPTAATDGRRLYYNREFIKKLDRQQLIFLVGHEILHCVFDHIGRRGSRNPKIWNMAIDYIVNYTLVKHKVGKKIDSALYNERYTDEWTSDEVYNDLKERSVEIEVPLDEHLSLGDDDEGDQENGQKGNNGKTKVTVTPGNGEDGPVKVSEEELERIRNEVKKSVMDAAQAADDAGSVPASIKRMINELNEPKMDWREMLDLHIKSSIKDDYTYALPSRRSFGSNFIFPGMDLENTIDVAIAVDVSGSISDEQLRDFLSEVYGIMEEFEDFRLRIWSFDTQPYAYAEFTPDSLDEFLEWQPHGGGGTDFMCNWHFMKDPSYYNFDDVEEIEPHRLVMFTDGMPWNEWGDPDYCDTLFVIHNNRSVEAPFGITAHYEDAQKD